jgi:heme exporter protein C
MRTIHVLLALLFVTMIASLWCIFMWAPTEATMGNVQRIFYFHVSSAWVSFIAFFTVFVSSLLYLIKRKDIFDHVALSSAEIGVLFSSFVLTTGPLWAKPVWGIWWTWDARLTSMFVLWLMYVSYLILRAFVTPEYKKKILAAVVGIVGFIDVPIVYLSIRLWRTQHPSPVIAGGEGSGIDPVMFKTLHLTFFAFILFYLVFMKLRISILKVHEELDQFHHSLRRNS